MGSREKINAVLWNIQINLQKLADICGYELPKFANFHTKRPNRSENIPKSFRGATFFKHHVYCSSSTSKP